MALQHPKNPFRRARQAGGDDEVFTSEAARVPSHRLPAGEMRGEVAYQIVHDELMLDGNARLNLATFVTTYMDPHADKLMAETFDKNMIDKDEYPQTAAIEMRCVNMLSRLFNSPEPDKATGCSTTGSSEAAMLGGLALKRQLAAAAQGRGQARRQAQPRHRHQRPGVLGQVRQLLGRGDAPRADGGRPLPPLSGGSGQALRREHHRRGRGDGVDVRRQLRGRQEDVGAARRSAAAHRTRHPDPRGRRVRRLHRAVPRPGSRVGLPRAPRPFDQRVGAQVRPRVPGRRLGDLARRRGPARGPHLLGQLPRRRDADVRAQLLAPGLPGRRPVLQLPAPRVRGLPARAAVRARRGRVHGRRRSRSWARSSCSRAETSSRCSPSR